MSERRPEKEEEKREKEEEKRTEKGAEEKGRHDPVGTITFAAVLIWGGIVALISIGNLVTVSWWQGWPVFFTGVGVILLVEAVVRMRPEYRRHVGGTVVLGIILLVLGLSSLLGTGWDVVWPIILIAIGVVLVLRQLVRRH